MARRGLVEREKRRALLTSRHAGQRAALKELIRVGDPEARDAAVRRLSTLPRDSSPVRRRSRDQIDGRPRGVLSRFGLSRVRFRELALRGELPGVRKACL
jgi:small subunit ribosomal protein S14